MLLVLPGSSLSKEVIINAMIDFDSPASPTPDQVTQAFNSIVNLTNPMDSRGLNATIFASSDVVTSQKLFVTILGQKTNHELALNGNTEDEKLSSMPYSKQLELLTTAQKNINSAHVCGGKVVSIGGFRPQSFDHNNNTLKVLESLGFLYDAGFVVGTLYLPGHKNDTWPYPIMGYNLYAVPVSSYNSSGVRVNLSDRYAKEELGISGSKWYDILAAKFDEAAINGDPMVVVFSNQVSGSGDYLDAYKNFVNYATSKNAKFVTTTELINMTEVKNASGKLPALSASGVKPSVCPTCGQNNESKGSLAIGVTVTHQGNCTDCNKTSTNVTKPK
jgi:intracellular sulfur oxidation DsrE/DsrF family protein